MRARDLGVLVLSGLLVGCTPYTTRLTVDPARGSSPALSKAEETWAQDAVGRVCQNLGLVLNLRILELREESRSSPEWKHYVLVSYGLPSNAPPGDHIRVSLLREKSSGAVSVLIRDSSADYDTAFLTKLESELKAALVEAVPGGTVVVARE